MFQIRKGKVNMLFKTLPIEKISGICLGGALGIKFSNFVNLYWPY